MTFSFSASNRIQVEMTTRYIAFQQEQTLQVRLDDNMWHTIYFEASTKRAFLRVDGSGYVFWEPMEPVYQKIAVGRNLIIGRGDDRRLCFLQSSICKESFGYLRYIFKFSSDLSQGRV